MFSVYISEGTLILHKNALGRKNDMSDERIIELFWQRNEEAIALSQETYGSECFALSERILNCTEDAEECVNDTWLRAWNAIPPTRPLYLATSFLSQ